MELRRLRPADAPAFRALRLRALREHPDAVRVGDRSFAKNHMHLDVRRTP
jgi:hypothetical protein